MCIGTDTVVAGFVQKYNPLGCLWVQGLLYGAYGLHFTLPFCHSINLHGQTNPAPGRIPPK